MFSLVQGLRAGQGLSSLVSQGLSSGRGLTDLLLDPPETRTTEELARPLAPWAGPQEVSRSLKRPREAVRGLVSRGSVSFPFFHVSQAWSSRLKKPEEARRSTSPGGA